MPVTAPTPGAPPVQRLRVRFGVRGCARYVPHLDLTRAWVRALRRLQVPLSYTHGFNPRPRVSVAAPLPVGFAAEDELLDLYLDSPMNADELAARLRPELPAGLTLHAIEAVPLQAPALPSQIEAADYVISFYHSAPADLGRRVEGLMAAESVPFTRVRRDKEVHFDLRPRILAASVEEREGRPVLALHLAHGPRGAARPEDVLEALELALENARITRTALVLGIA